MSSMFYFIWADTSGRVYKVILMFTDVTERLAKVTLRLFFCYGRSTGSHPRFWWLIKDPITTISRKPISNIWKQQDSEQLKLQSENVVSLKSSGLDEHQWEIFKKRVLAMGAADNWGIGCCSNSNIRWQITTSSRWPSVSLSASSVISPSFLRCSVTGRYICMHSPHTFSPAFSHTLPPPPLLRTVDQWY